MDKPFQRKGSKSNTQVGIDLEAKTQAFFKKVRIPLTPGPGMEGFGSLLSDRVVCFPTGYYIASEKLLRRATCSFY